MGRAQGPQGQACRDVFVSGAHEQPAVWLLTQSGLSLAQPRGQTSQPAALLLPQPLLLLAQSGAHTAIQVLRPVLRTTSATGVRYLALCSRLDAMRGVMAGSVRGIVNFTCFQAPFLRDTDERM